MVAISLPLSTWLIVLAVGLVLCIVRGIGDRQSDKQRAANVAEHRRDELETSSGSGEPAANSAATAGWHPDPWAQSRLRYWDGVSWTNHVAD